LDGPEPGGFNPAVLEGLAWDSRGPRVSLHFAQPVASRSSGSRKRKKRKEKKGKTKQSAKKAGAAWLSAGTGSFDRWRGAGEGCNSKDESIVTDPPRKDYNHKELRWSVQVGKLYTLDADQSLCWMGSGSPLLTGRVAATSGP